MKLMNVFSETMVDGGGVEGGGVVAVLEKDSAGGMSSISGKDVFPATLF